MRKICPLNGGEVGTQLCRKRGCQLWIEVVKDRIMVDGSTKFADPDHLYVYKGCGLVQAIPWALVSTKKKGSRVANPS